MSPDDFDGDDLLDDRRADLEVRFRELEREAEMERLRRETGAATAERGQPAREATGAAERPSTTAGPAAEDPLAGMKAALDGDGQIERYLLVLCPSCGAKNRMSLKRVRSATPLCGRCKKDLAPITR